MAFFAPTNWIWIAAFFLGAIILAIVLCVIICLCRRRCAKRRIREALQLQENYLGNTPTNKTSSNNSISNKPITVAPIVNMKSVTMLNVAEDSDENDEHTDEIHDDDHDDNKQQSNEINNENPKSKSKRTRILDLSIVSDVVNSDIKTTNGVAPKYNINTPMMDDTQLNSSAMLETINTGTGSGSSGIRHGHGGAHAHAQQTSFVLDTELDYYAQVQQMGNDQRGRQGSEYTTGSRGSRGRSNKQSKTNTDIILDDDDDVEFDYGSQM